LKYFDSKKKRDHLQWTEILEMSDEQFCGKIPCDLSELKALQDEFEYRDELGLRKNRYNNLVGWNNIPKTY
jgi:hypothetical protein